jgi:hypothetical protein
MRKIGWNSLLIVALIAASGIIVGALITETPPLFVHLRLGPERVVAGSPTEGLLGRGSAELKVPQTLPETWEGTVHLRVHLKEKLDPEDLDFTHGDLSPPEVAEQPGTDISPPMRTINYKDELPIYSRMCATLDAPTFRYIEGSCERDLLSGESAEWSWVIHPQRGYLGHRQVIVHVSAVKPDGTHGASWPPLAASIEVVPTTATPPRVPPATAVLSPTLTPVPQPTDTPEPATPVPTEDPEPLAPTPDLPPTSTPTHLPTATLTHVPTPSPTLVPTATPRPGDVLYKADWSDGMNGWAGTPDWKHIPDMLISDGSVWIGMITPPYQPETQDYAIEAQIQLLNPVCGNTYQGFGLIARAEDEQRAIIGGINCHEAAIASVNFGSSTSPFSTIAFQPFDPGKEWHTYRLEVKGNTIRLLVDGALLLEEVDNAIFTNDKVGLFSGSAQINVRNFKVIQL